MGKHPLAGKPAPLSMRINVPQLVTAYFVEEPDSRDVTQQVSFGTSGHRGSSLVKCFNQAHIVAITQAICEVRRRRQVDGPLFLGKDTHALSEPAFATALEVLAAQGVTVCVAHDLGFTPTPVISHAILTHNHEKERGRADGIVITPSHNPPEHGGFKYNPPHGGPADSTLTSEIAARANELLATGWQRIKRVPFGAAIRAATTRRHDYVTPYVTDLAEVVDLEQIVRAGLRIGVDPLGGSGVGYWAPLADRYGLSLEVVNPVVDPTFGFMTVDKDGQIRMDCSSPDAMASLIGLKDRFDIAFGNDPDFDRHGIVTSSAGLMNPNHFLSVAVAYLFRHRPEWGAGLGVGKTLVSSSMIDRVAQDLGRSLIEVPVGFKWFVSGLLQGQLGFGGEESAGASFVRKDGRVWTTDKDGIILDLLAAEMTARMEKDPGEQYRDLVQAFGEPVYQRIDAPATREQKKLFSQLTPESVSQSELAGESVVAKLTRAPGNDAPIGGLKVVTPNGWFAARPSGTEDVYKIYAESFLGSEHLSRIQAEARQVIDELFATLSA